MQPTKHTINPALLLVSLFLCFGLANCGLPDDGGSGETPYVTVRVTDMSIETRFVDVTGEADCYPGPYPVKYRWNAASLNGCFKIPAQCFVGSATYPIALMGIKDNGEVIQNGMATVKGTTENLRPPLGPVQTLAIKMVARNPTFLIKNFRPNAAWPEMYPCQ